MNDPPISDSRAKGTKETSSSLRFIRDELDSQTMPTQQVFDRVAAGVENKYKVRYKIVSTNPSKKDTLPSK